MELFPLPGMPVNHMARGVISKVYHNLREVTAADSMNIIGSNAETTTGDKPRPRDGKVQESRSWFSFDLDSPTLVT